MPLSPTQRAPDTRRERADGRGRGGTVHPGRSTAAVPLPLLATSDLEVRVADNRVLATISILGAVVAGILFGVLIFADQPTVLEVDFSPSSETVVESDATATP
jgi:hypothetical protein